MAYAYAPQQPGYPAANPYAQPQPVAAQPVYYTPQQYSAASQPVVYPVAVVEDPAGKAHHHHATHSYAVSDGAKAPTVPAGGLAAVEGGGGSYSEQMEKAVRLGFIRKVYSVLMLQLAVTFGLVAVFTFSETVRNFVQSTPELLFSAIAVSFVALIAMACCSSVTRTYPYNYIALAIFTLCEGYLVGTIASFYKTDAVLIAVGGTVLITVGLTLFAWQTKIDFTAMSSAIFVIALSFLFFGILVAIMRSNILRLVYACVGVVIFGLFLVYDTQVSNHLYWGPLLGARHADAYAPRSISVPILSASACLGVSCCLMQAINNFVFARLLPFCALQLILGGKHREYSYGPDDFVIAALNIYLDIINIFLYLLRE